MGQDYVIKRSTSMDFQETTRKGVREKKLLTADECPDQNLILISIEKGAEVELHQIHCSETIFLLDGELEIIFADENVRLKSGDCCYFKPGSLHGMRCSDGPARFLAVFSPSKDFSRVEK